MRHVWCFKTFICCGPYHVTAALVGQAFGIYPEFCLPWPAWQTKAWFNSWGCRPIQVGSHINIRHVCELYDVSQPSYAVDVPMYMSPYHITAALVDQAFVSCLEIRVPSKGANHSKCDSWGCRPIQVGVHIACMMFHNLHMLRMYISMSPYHITAALVGQSFGIYPDFCLPPAG